MIRNLSILFFFAAFLSEACSNKSTSIHADPVLVAWNEDTVNSYQITLLENKNFYYAILKTEDGVKRVKSFSGTYRISSDSIFLNVATGSKPPELVNYLVREASDDYVIQYFSDNTKRMFLRKQRVRYRF